MKKVYIYYKNKEMAKKLTTKDFIEKAKSIHGDKYDYSKVEYNKSTEKVCVICSKHGEFWQEASSHLRGIGCPKCGGTKKLTKEDFILRAREIHGWKYDYSKVEYVNIITPVCIICPKHGEFWQRPNDHLLGKGCLSCSGNKKKTTDEFIEKAKSVHGDKYDYSKVDYKGAHKKVCIICPKHGEFWQTPDNHFRFGCKKCFSSKIEDEVKIFLSENSIKFEEQKTFEWLKYKSNLKLDFYLPEYNLAIECQGEQHFKKYRFEKDDKRLNLRIERDKVKHFLCCMKNINIVYYTSFNSDFYSNKITCKNIIELKKILENYGFYKKN